MRFTETRLAGAYTIDIERREDDRGSFARVFCRDAFAAAGLPSGVAQANVSHNRLRGTLRGLHFQYPPAAETKYVRCTRGALLDVIVDLRPESATYLEHVAIRLSSADGRGLYIPDRFAHGFLTLEDETEITYLMGHSYAPGAAGGLRYDDPALAIAWPIPVRVVSDRDRQWRPLRETAAELRDRMSILEMSSA